MSTADRVLEVQRVHESPDLVTVPHVAALELGQRHGAEIDLVENRSDLRDVDASTWLQRASRSQSERPCLVSRLRPLTDDLGGVSRLLHLTTRVGRLEGGLRR